MNVCMLTYSFYESDNRVRRYAEALIRRGDSVDVLSLRRKGQDYYNELNGVRIFRIQERVRNEKGKLSYLIRIFKFLFCSTYTLVRKHLFQPYDLIHVHSVPDFEVFAALIPKLIGAKIILDIHDIVPEFYAAKFNGDRESFVFKMLVWVEKISIAIADHVIISNDLWKKTLCSRSVRFDKCTTIINYPDESIFFKRETRDDKKKVVFLYPGSLNHHQGLDLAVKAFDQVKNLVRGAELHIVGEGPEKQQLVQMVRGLSLEDRVIFKDQVSLDAIPKIMAKADIGIIPKRNNGFGSEAFSTKTLEFMILGIPIIVSRTKIDQLFFDNSVVKYFEAGNIGDLAGAMLAMIKDKALRDRLAVNGLQFARNNSWNVKKQIYLDLVDGLVSKGRIRKSEVIDQPKDER